MKWFLICVASFFMIGCLTFEPEDEFCDDSNPEFYHGYYEGLPDFSFDWAQCYNKATWDWEEEWNLPEGWARWMIINRHKFLNAFIRAHTNRSVVVSFWYEGEGANYSSIWRDEEEHMAILEELVELKFPTWDFDFIFEDEEEDADVIVHANYEGISNCCADRIMNLHYETIFSHEFSHFLRIPHHYNSMETFGNGENMPPGEFETGCIMDRTANQFGSAERFALGIPMDVDNSDLIQELDREINSRYREGY